MKKGKNLPLFFLLFLFLIGCRKDIPPYEIGVFFSSSPHDETTRENIRMGMEIGFEEINTIKGVRGRMLKGVYIETPKDESLMIAAIKDSIMSRSVKVVLSHDRRMAEILTTLDTLDIILFSDWKGRTTLEESVTFAITPRLKTEGRSVGRAVVRDLRYKKGFLLLSEHKKEDADFAEGFRRGFVDESKGTLNTIVLPQIKDEREELFGRIVAFSVEVVVLVSGEETAPLITELRDSGYSGKVIVPSNACEYLKGDISTDLTEVYSGVSDYEPDSKRRIIANFQERFEEKFGRRADYTASVHYDLAEIIAYFLEINGDDTQRIRKFLGKIRNYNAVTGRTSYFPDGEVEKPIRLQSLKDTKSI
jgi:ABC-type branched-subunit amino acid transport system substrate-binding protein